MTNNYIGPGWYWVEGTNQPPFLFSKSGRLTSMVYVENIGVRESTTSCGEPFRIIDKIERQHARPVVDWSVMPAWAKWVAVDKSGTWCWYTDEPSINDRHYVVDNGIYGTIPREHAPTYTGDWKNSLVGRPE